MQKITRLKEPLYIESFASVGGYEEARGPLGHLFDFTDKTDLFGMKTWERAESEMSRTALNIALKKGFLSNDMIDVIVAGDLQNQCESSYSALYTFGIPCIGLYGACSTATEGLIVLSSILSSSENYTRGATVTSSHNSVAERQFRTPLEYGAQRYPTAQWTATAAGAFILGKNKTDICVSSYMPGRVIDGYSSDASSMGAAMALAAFDSISRFFEEEDPDKYDLILTGDLGAVGSDVLKSLLSKNTKHGKKLATLHRDSGLLLYSKDTQDVHSGASGCGCSAAVLASLILPMIQKKELSRIALLSTGALMSPSSICQGEHILGVAPLIVIEGV